MENKAGHTETLEKIRRLIKDIDIGMFVTHGTGEVTRSRPMSCNGDIDDDGTLYFFTRGDSRLVSEIDANAEVSISFADSRSHNYVTFSGTAFTITDKSILERHWKPQLKAWFPDGVDSPEVMLLRVSMREAEYWESHGGLVSHTLSFAKTMLGGKPADVSEHGRVVM